MKLCPPRIGAPGSGVEEICERLRIEFGLCSFPPTQLERHKLLTIDKFLACWNMQLMTYTPEVVYCLGAALKWRGYSAADLFLYLSKTLPERHGAEGNSHILTRIHISEPTRTD